MTISREKTFRILEAIYLILSVFFLFPGGLFFLIMAGFFSDSGENIYRAYISLSIPFMPITLYFIILLFRRMNKHGKSIINS